MREVNFSIPNANKASVSITTALYDRRALDCTSTLPLINSLNHLAYLTNSSARIREILTSDGGVERLVCILKNGRSKDVMDTWKWNLAFQCVVNIGVRGSDARGSDNRGSENVRTRVVEADMVPVIATILDNYMQILEKLRAKDDDPDVRRSGARCSKRSIARHEDQGAIPRPDRRRAIPPPIDIPPEHTTHHQHRRHSSHNHRHDIRAGPVSFRGQQLATQPGLVPEPPPWSPIRNIDNLPSPTALFHNVSTPQSPTTPTATGAARTQSPVHRSNAARSRSRRRPTIRHGISSSGISDDDQIETSLPEDNGAEAERSEPVVGIQTDMDLDDVAERTTVVDVPESQDVLPAPEMPDNVDRETFDLNHPLRPLDGSIIDQASGHTNGMLFPSPTQRLANLESQSEVPQPSLPNQSRLLHERLANPQFLVQVPRDEDVIMSLQLLAYVSKYTELRNYFRKSHLVPKLKICKQLNNLENDPLTEPLVDDDNDEEYCQPNDFDIFPLVEKFTVRHHSYDMKYWAGVVMRNLCRKDKTRGDIRQCAYYECGQWEKFARQFAKCRRCRQTKYCSKECQKSAWVYHRHWCQQAQANDADANSQPE